MLLHPLQGQGVVSLIEGGRDGAQQPVLQDAHTANTAFVEIEPVLDDQRLSIGIQRDFLKQRQERRLEFGAIFLALELIAGEMDRQTTPRCLPIQPGKAQKIIGAHQNICYLYSGTQWKITK